jgi:hypothetical protein
MAAVLEDALAVVVPLVSVVFEAVQSAVELSEVVLLVVAVVVEQLEVTHIEAVSMLKALLAPVLAQETIVSDAEFHVVGVFAPRKKPFSY